MWKRAATLGLCVWMVAGPLPAEEPSSDDSPADRAIIEQIMALGRQIDELLSQLPEHRRQELRQRLAEASGETAAEPPAIVEPTRVEPAIVEPTRVEPAPTHLPLLKRRAPPVSCNTLLPFDENQDSQISSADRYWRYFYLWIDKNRDGQMQEREVDSAYERGVREIAASAETFVRTKGSLGETRIDEHILFDLAGDGFSDQARQDDGVLLIDATAVRRGDGPEILDPGGASLTGLQAFRAGLQVRESSGRISTITCPRGSSG